MKRPAYSQGVAETPDRLLAGLTTEQRDAVTTRVSPLCIIAGAGSGKTRVLTTRIAWQAQQGRADPRRMLAVTFTRAAAHELRDRVRKHGLRDAVKAGTFHAVALAQLCRNAADSSRRPPQILTNPHRLISQLRPRTDQARITSYVNEINWARSQLVTPDGYVQAARAHRRNVPQAHSGGFARLYADYETAKIKRRLHDFNDVLTDALDLMTSDRKYASAWRWLHQHLLVDEFHDINPLQFALLKSWLGPESTLVVVGDPDQAIYGWNGADPELINEVRSHFSGCVVMRLRSNFRSTPEVLLTAAAALGKQPQPAVRPAGAQTRFTVCDGNEEAAVLARAIREHHRPGASWGHQAVLARTNDHLDALALELPRYNIDVRMPTGATVRDLQASLGEMADAWRDTDRLSFALADTRHRLAPSDDQAGEVTHQSSTSGGPATPSARDVEARLASVDLVLRLGMDHLALDPTATVADFWSALRTGRREVAGADETEGVHMMTFHAAKGLEWPVVHLVGIEEGFVPIARARSRASIAEERRLLYVAMTRARSHLHLLWCNRRTIGGESLERSPSRWIAGLIDGSKGSPFATAEEQGDQGDTSRFKMQRELNLKGIARARQALSGEAF